MLKLKSLKIASVIATTVVLAGCATQTFTVNPKGNRSLRSEDSQTFFINGIGQEQMANAAKVCGGASRINRVQVQQTFLDGFLGSITFGLYTPRTARVFCNS